MDSLQWVDLHGVRAVFRVSLSLKFKALVIAPRTSGCEDQVSVRSVVEGGCLA